MTVFIPLVKAFIFTENFCPVSGVPQSSQGARHGSARHCQAGDGHPDPGGACPDGGRAPDADPLDEEDHRGGGPHGPTAGPHLASDRAALQGGDALRVGGCEGPRADTDTFSHICFEVSLVFHFSAIMRLSSSFSEGISPL